MSNEVKASGPTRGRRRRIPGRSRISSKHQITLPVAALRAAGLDAGDEVEIVADGHGALSVRAAADPLDEFVGSMTGVYAPDHVDKLRDDWQR